MKKISLLFFLFSISLNANEMEIFFNYINTGNYNLARTSLNNLPNKELKTELNIFLDIVHLGIFPKNYKKSNSKNPFSLQNNISTLNNGLYDYLKKGNEISAFKIFKKSLEIAKKRNDKLLIRESIKFILEIYERFNMMIEDTSYKYFINECKKNTTNTLDNQICTFYEYRITQRYFYRTPEEIKNYYVKANKFIDKSSPEFLKAKLDLTNSAYHQLVTKDIDSSHIYLTNSINILKNLDGYFENERLQAAIINNAVLQFKKGLLQKSEISLNNIKIKKDGYLFKLLRTYLHFWKYKLYKTKGDSTKSLYYYNKYLINELKNNQAKNLQIVSEYETKFQTAEKEKQILIEQQKKKRNQNIAIGLGGSLFLGSVIAILIYRNTKRKQRIAEQEREIEIQKTEKLLREQELTAIDAMISGQEKERQRLANDLHDNLGSTLATVKLHFDHLKNNRNNPKVENIEELYSKTNNLLDEAYQKVRTIAHEKNSGVMAKQGLLPAVRNLAKKASNGNRLQIEVQDYGLNERLDNALEISIFRIIQELITNTIKHADASEIGISLTNHDSLLNIIVEDNGKGFNAKVLPEKDGMGLKSIEKRIEHLEGTFEIDSTIGKGTNIIINIPI
ncbi:sensor histidine kinase [Aquimarina sp. AD1]|uniref:sensor histidine kinase n=2 Tax=Aquimarina sp. (strain AD1) TaxID=1714848 RepID=UPI0013C2E3C6|nr:sensor histidine kinase [Aquimarina sp. AD1]